METAKRSLDEVVALSRRYGASVHWVIRGGGNTSVKGERWMWVKASGSSLGTITTENFVRMDRARLAAIWDKVYPAEADAREAAAKSDLLVARAPGEEEKRPTVESLMHALFPQRYVYHSHPTIGNALLCSIEGEAAARRIFGDDMVWIPIVNAGYVLAQRLRSDIAEYRNRHSGNWPRYVLMQNHGIVVAGDTAEEVDALHAEFEQRMMDAVGPDSAAVYTGWASDGGTAVGFAPDAEPGLLAGLMERLVSIAQGREGDPPCAVSDVDPVVKPFLQSAERFDPLDGALTPDHIVYSGHLPAWVQDPADVERVFDAYRAEHGVDPKIVAVQGAGVIALGASQRAAESALLLFRDAARIATLAPAFGGVRFMPSEEIDFIRNWEVEAFRAKVAE